MMIFSNVFLRFKKLLSSLFNIVWRLFCCRRKQRRNSGMILPVVVTKTDSNCSPPYTPPQCYDTYSYQSHTYKPSSPVNEQVKKEEEEEDFFKDMEPYIKRQKRIYVPVSKSPSPSQERLSFDPKTEVHMNPDLGLLQDNMPSNSGWEDESALGDVDAALKMARRAERERRLAEHKRIKMEKDMNRGKIQRTNMIVSKIS